MDRVHARDMTSTTQSSIFDTFAQRDDFLGFGYIGGRTNAADAIASGEWTSADIAGADAAVLKVAADLGWDEDRLFMWANSKDGRWFADMALGCNDISGALRLIR